MRRVFLSFLILILSAGGCYASIAVSPVIIEDFDTVAGKVYTINILNETDRTQRLIVELGRFDQNEMGQIVYDEGIESREWAKGILDLPSEIVLEPKTANKLVVALKSAEFDSAFPVVFLKQNGGNISWRMAILFLLATGEIEGAVEYEFTGLSSSSILVTLRNIGMAHQAVWEEISYIDEYGDVLEKEDFLIGRILPGRSRQVILTPPSGTAYVEILGKRIELAELTR
ncbi:MAG: hypothetical protein GX020_00625 [Firmicutes bacterium]|nr:hypothetical protein [Bacillota bacterium]